MRFMRRTGRLLHLLKKNIRYSHTDSWKTVGILAAATLICFLLKPVGPSDSHVPLIFVLAVLLISRSTGGYLYGLIASAVAVFGVNYVFTYPYYELNFTMTGYPLTFICMFAVSAITCTLTTAVKQGELERIENERERMRANLLRAISHDLRTPLTSIMGAVDVAIENDEGLTAEDRRSILTEVRGEAEWLNNIVDNILSITRFGDSAWRYLRKEPEIAEEVVDEAVHKFRRQFSAKEIMVHVRVPDEVLIVPMDAMLIEQVLINLMINAASHGGRVDQINISAQKDGCAARFVVSDNGDGIKEQLLPHLFEYDIEYPKEGSQNDNNRFMGIGLSVCKTIIQVHGGEIKARNLPSGGAEFTFTLPMGKESEDVI